MRKESPAGPAEPKRLRGLGAGPFVGAAAFANLLALDRMAGEDSSRSIGLARFALAALVLAAGAMTLFRGPFRGPRVSRDHLAFLAAIAAFGLGVIELDLPAFARLS